MVMSKNKGNTFERKISKRLSERFKQKTGLDQSFRRNIDSGSFFGGKNQKRTVSHDLDKASFGDIVCPSNFRYNIECKHYKTPPSFNMMLKQSCKDWDEWINQASQDCKNSNKKMCIIIKYNNVEEFVIIEHLPTGYSFIGIQYKQHMILSLDNFLMIDDSEFFE